MIPVGIARELLDDVFLSDDSPSSAVQSAHYDPEAGIVEIAFHTGRSYSFACTVDQWIAYKSADSKGSALSDVFGISDAHR